MRAILHFVLWTILWVGWTWADNTIVPVPFHWGFSDKSVSTQLFECSSRGISLLPLNSSDPKPYYLGTPPYYLTAAEIGGTPTTQMIGTNSSNLTWTVTHKAGTKLLLAVWDSLGNTGGVGSAMYTVQSGHSSSCIPPPPSTPQVQISSKISDGHKLKTCEAWDLDIVANGAGPFNVSLIAAGTGVTNVTMSTGDTLLQYINRTPPDVNVAAVVVDANGNFGSGTPWVLTTGSRDNDCAGLITQSLSATQAQQLEAGEGQHQHRSLALGLGITLPLLALFGAVGAWWWYRRRRALGQTSDSEKQFGGNRGFEKLVTPVVLPVSLSTDFSPAQMVAITGGLYSTPQSLHSPSSSVISGPLDLMARPSITTSRSTLATLSDGGSLAPSPVLPRRTTSVNSPSPLTMSTRQRKALEANARRPARSATALGIGSSSEPIRPPARSASALPSSVRPTRPRQQSLEPILDDSLAEGPVIQHQDGGALPELPPPYADRRA
ncbi:hypothetical protein PUNSTDRAFT_92833 [Punctularia strigosozonata HHB-11173 SS5]|uniref:Mid2 domain-containing protein n=1 Tax=Punctularia strigosozonata (strain HHB-11173) TaxID=741275 RepID=R7S3U5_PUNST|nr:uncharacterized protein PUNSTDRAFT_92833 [Punctularia strigosozonata HHB-11173 SS5]EIN04472.1 hypothetical protein PUNSTDRAFT_92833 [Punctularia strigosozonata HHB-11173 SS5]